MAKSARMDERISIVQFLLCGWNSYFVNYCSATDYIEALHQMLLHLKTALTAGSSLDSFVAQQKNTLKVKQANGLLSASEESCEIRVLNTLESYSLEAAKRRLRDAEEIYEMIKIQFAGETTARRTIIEQTSRALSNGFSFAEDAFGTGPEMTLLVNDLTQNPRAMRFLTTHGCTEYLKYSKALLFHKKQQELLKEIEAISSW